ncbi:MAG TPA: VWA domain-containing protein [Longimicrobiales bacterium]
MKTEILLDHEPANDGAAYVVRALLRLHGDPPTADDRVPLNIGIVLDRSGSMAGAPLEAAKEAAALLVRRLAPVDVVSVVAYDDAVRTVAEPATGDAQHDLIGRIHAIRSGGCTNLSGGWLRGRDLVAASKRDGATHRLLLLTDGLANVGITDPDRLVGLCRNAREAGIVTTTIGFGPDYDEVLLRRMAEAGGGSMYYIERPDQAPAVFAEEIDGLLSLRAQNIAVEIRPAAAARLACVHHRYPSEPLDDGLRLELGDLYARDPRVLLAEFLVVPGEPAAAGAHGAPRATGAPAGTGASAAPGTPAGAVDVAELTLTAHVVAENGSIERREIRLPIRASLAEGPRVDPDVRRELLLQEAARAREAAYEAQRRGDDDAAGGLLREAAEHLALEDLVDPELLEEAADLAGMAELFDAGRASEADAKYLYQRGYARRANRRGTARVISRKPPEPRPDAGPRGGKGAEG